MTKKVQDLQDLVQDQQKELLRLSGENRALLAKLGRRNIMDQAEDGVLEDASSAPPLPRTLLPAPRFHHTCQNRDWSHFDLAAVQAYMNFWRARTKLDGQLPYRLWERDFT